MQYALLPFSTRTRDHDYVGRADIRAALAERRRSIAETAIDNLELLDLVADKLQELPWRVMVDHCIEQDGRLHLAVLAPDMGRNLVGGDEVNAGFYLQNSERSVCDTLACSRVFRVACANGALVECDQTQTLTIGSAERPPGDWQRRVVDVIGRAFSGEGVDIDAARFGSTMHQMIVAPFEFLCHLAAQGLIDDDEQSQIQAAFDDEGDLSMYGLINAVTQVAHGLRDNDRWVRSFEIERLGGEILRGDHNLPTLEFARSR
ncbi:hypothetical protein Pla123a_20810 [Posidoniimonas polymericola]|uniref:Uncharacterized protein n=1 Tax=Posidoniimonas polymericola TaxID=2528002 RepID=A0A5C5YRR6_9BACT|nr:hypothetical protein [Posidoniimonas polymericola]TWT77420.1 hypothetical protein Pla123a_20810 [Posidoniimonas polymericola]